LGYALLIAIMVGLFVYQVLTINRMLSINDEMSSVNIQKAHACLQAMRDRDLVEEYTRKSFASSELDYLTPLEEFQESFEANLTLIKNYAESNDERAEIAGLSKIWNVFKADLEPWKAEMPVGLTTLPIALQDHLDQLRIQTNSIYQSSMRSITQRIEQSRKTGETAVFVVWGVTFAALAISILVSFLIYRSISKPLAHLTEGTRAIAEGKFFYRLDTSRKDEFSQLAKDFNTMIHRLNELDELKKGFVTHVSHELKAPLASMQETIQILLEQIPGPINKRQERLLKLTLQSGSRLTSMIGNLLDLAKTDAGIIEYKLESRDLARLVRSAVEELEAQAKEKQIHIKTSFPDAPMPVMCDGERIVQVLINLLGNAVKFSSRGASVEVKVEAVSDIPQNTPDRWRRLIADTGGAEPFGLLTIVDSGPGVPDAEKENIFERFRQAQQGKKLAGQGVGLGLAICRIILQAHRGALWVEDNPGGGSRFCVLLPPGGNVRPGVPRASRPI